MHLNEAMDEGVLKENREEEEEKGRRKDGQMSPLLRLPPPLQVGAHLSTCMDNCEP